MESAPRDLIHPGEQVRALLPVSYLVPLSRPRGAPMEAQSRSESTARTLRAALVRLRRRSDDGQAILEADPDWLRTASELVFCVCQVFIPEGAEPGQGGVCGSSGGVRA